MYGAAPRLLRSNPCYKKHRTALQELTDSLRIIRLIGNPSDINRHIAVLN